MSYKKFTEKRKGENVIPLLNSVCGVDLPKWTIAKESNIRQYLSGDAVNRLAELEDKIENARTVEIHYKPPFETKYAIVEYYARQGKPLKVAEYNIYGEELKTGKQLICWEYLSSTNFSVIKNGFDTKAEAEKRLKELQQ